MSTYDDDNLNEEATDEEAEDTGFVGTGGPASVIYGDDDEAADEAGEEMLRAPDDEGDAD